MRYTYTIMFFVLVLTGCTLDSTEEKEKTEQLREQASDTAQQAVKASDARDNWKALSLWNKTDELYAQIDEKKDNQYRFLVYKQKANILNRLEFHNKAVLATEKSIEFLKSATELGDWIDPKLSELSTLRYMGTYIRESKEYVKSNKVLLPLISYPEKAKGLNAQVKNLIGLNFYDLHNYHKAYQYFDDILKISDLEPKMRAHYLINRGKAQYKLGNKMEAFNDVSQALGINQGLGRDMYTFLNYMELGEMNMLETNFDKADQNFNKALSIFKKIDNQPDHFKIYNLKYTTASVLGDPKATSFKIRFDSLTRRHKEIKTTFSLQEEEALYAAGIGKWEYENLRREQWYDNPTVLWMLSSLILILLLVAFRPNGIMSYRNIGKSVTQEGY